MKAAQAADAGAKAAEAADAEVDAADGASTSKSSNADEMKVLGDVSTLRLVNFVKTISDLPVEEPLLFRVAPDIAVLINSVTTKRTEDEISGLATSLDRQMILATQVWTCMKNASKDAIIALPCFVLLLLVLSRIGSLVVYV